MTLHGAVHNTQSKRSREFWSQHACLTSQIQTGELAPAFVAQARPHTPTFNLHRYSGKPADRRVSKYRRSQASRQAMRYSVAVS